LTGCDAALTGEASNLPAEDVSLPGDGLTLSGDSALPVSMRFRRQNIFPVFFVPFYKTLFFAPYFTLCVERLMEYQRAARMPALRHFILELEKRVKLALILSQMQNTLFWILRRKCFV
jgi:hypothetical protein